MSFNHFVRRLHLYLALSLLPWFFVYGASSLPFSHPSWFNSIYDDGVPLWKLRFERPYERAVPEGADLRAIGAEIMKDAGVEGSFGTYRPNDRELHVYVHTFWRATQLKYFLEQKKLRAEDRRFRWDQFLTGMHARGGFENRQPLALGWSIVVDVVCVGFLVWIASGIYMWWHIPGTRRWGWLALGGGAAMFAFFLLRL
jgi:hypothetical protein